MSLTSSLRPLDDLVILAPGLPRRQAEVVP